MTIRLGRVLFCSCVAAFVLSQNASAARVEYPLTVLPPEHKTMTDPETGAECTFLTTALSRDTNLYFHERSWLADSSMILFNSDRPGGGLMGYLTATGELVQLKTPTGGLTQATAAALKSCFYAMRGSEVVELSLDVKVSNDPATRSRVTASEEVVCTLPKGVHTTALNASCDGRRLATGITGGDERLPNTVAVIDIKRKRYKALCVVPPEIGYGGHIQWSQTNPNLISFAGRSQRLWVVDTRDGKPWNPYPQQKSELVTHESWWVRDQIIFCGGVNPKPQEDAHVKALDIYTGEVRIVGEGSWWPSATPVELAKRNWWHCAGSADGRWVVADNWHGDLMLFEGKTTRPHRLVQGHRTYGKGDHPHVGWDRAGKQVVFTSHLLGDPNVCVATIPDALQQLVK